jgi:hypothetical protein
MSETVTHLSRQCPRCGRQLPPDAPEGLCAWCLLTAGTETLTGSGDATSTGVASAEDPSRPGAPRLVDGQVWGPYRVVRLLGRGGMGEVYEAEQLETGRRLALKVLRDTLRGDQDRARFLREGQLAASISHAHTVYVFGSEEVGGAPAITMELLPGGTLKDRVSARGPLPPAAAVSAVLDIIGGLDAAQAAGILHRDIKPSNCFVDADGTVKVGDFGLSISTLTRDVRRELAAAGFEGTPQFAAPEQLRGEPLDVRADIYAVGATLYYLLTGRPPLDAPDLGELVSRVVSEKPPSPRVHRRDIPRGLADVVLRCLAKAPAGRPQSYAELRDRLRPYEAADEDASPLGARVIAWIADSVIIAILMWLLASTTWAVGLTFESAITLLRVAAWSWLSSVIYFLVLEGCWGASLGKQLMGLHVTSRRSTGWWPRIALRTAVYHLPKAVPASLFAAGVIQSVALGDAGRITYSTNPASTAWLVQPEAVLTLLLTVLLFSTARRGNHWTGVHELLSGTRVVQRAAPRSVVSAAAGTPGTLGMSAVDFVPGSAPARRIGPYVVDSTLGGTGGGRLLIGVDPILRRPVWIHETPRSASENWDAFEAPRGKPFLTAPPTSDWREVHRALSSLAAELHASARDNMDTRVTLANVWRRADGQLVLLDFPWPGLDAPGANQACTAVELLAAVATRALDPTPAPSAPLSGTALLRRLAGGSPPALAAVHAELVRLASVPDRPSRLRRALPMAMAALPVTVLLLIATVMLPLVARSLQGDAGRFFSQTSEMIMWMTWITDSGAEAVFKTQEQRTAAEQYVAAHFGSQLRSDEFWNTQLPPIEPFLGMRRKAAEIAARYPAVSPDQLARASAIVAPQIEDLAAQRASMKENFPAGGEALRGFLASGFASLPVLLSIACGFISGLALPGGLVTRALRHAVVRRDGREIGRARSAIRILIAWSPALAWIACVGVPMFGEPRVTPDVAVVVGSLALSTMAAGAAWAIANPGRGPHDHVAGTWVVPR